MTDEHTLLAAQSKKHCAEKEILGSKIANLKLSLKAQIEKNQALKSTTAAENSEAIELERVLLAALMAQENEARTRATLTAVNKMKEKSLAAPGNPRRANKWVQRAKRIVRRAVRAI